MNRMCRLGEAEELLSEMDFSDVADDIAETEEDTQLIVSGWWVFLPQLNLQLHEGILCNWDEEEQMFMPDVAVTSIDRIDAAGSIEEIREKIYGCLEELCRERCI